MVTSARPRQELGLGLLYDVGTLPQASDVSQDGLVGLQCALPTVLLAVRLCQRLSTKTCMCFLTQGAVLFLDTADESIQCLQAMAVHCYTADESGKSFSILCTVLPALPAIGIVLVIVLLIFSRRLATLGLVARDKPLPMAAFDAFASSNVFPAAVKRNVIVASYFQFNTTEITSQDLLEP